MCNLCRKSREIRTQLFSRRHAPREYRLCSRAVSSHTTQSAHFILATTIVGAESAQWNMKDLYRNRVDWSSNGGNRAIQSRIADRMDTFLADLFKLAHEANVDTIVVCGHSLWLRTFLKFYYAVIYSEHAFWSSNRCRERKQSLVNATKFKTAE